MIREVFHRSLAAGLTTLHTTRRGNIVAWCILVIAGIYTILLAFVTDPYAPNTVFLSLIQPLTSAAVVALLFISARQSTERWRWVWYLYSLSISFTVAGLSLQVIARLERMPLVTPLSTTLFLITYILALVADIIALARRSWLLGSTRRLVFDATALGVGAFVLVNALPIADEAKVYLAFNIALLFCVVVVALRFGRNGGPIVVFALLAAISLRAGDLVYALTLTHLGEAWGFLPGPIYTINRACIALAAYRSVVQPPRAPDGLTIERPVEWSVWAVVPPTLLLVAFFAASPAAVSPGLRVLMIAVGIGQILHSALDIRRVLQARHDLHNFAGEHLVGITFNVVEDEGQKRVQ